MATYSNTSRYRLTDNGTTAERKTAAISSYSQYVCREGDSFTKIAAQLFNDGSRYWEIADINPQIDFPDNLPVGTVIRLPK